MSHTASSVQAVNDSLAQSTESSEIIASGIGEVNDRARSLKTRSGENHISAEELTRLSKELDHMAAQFKLT